MKRSSAPLRADRRTDVAFTAPPRAIVTILVLQIPRCDRTTALARAASRPVSPASRSRSVSPSSVHASTVATSAMPGAIATHGAATIRSRPPAIMLPQLGRGG